MNSSAVLALENGMIFEGTAIGVDGLSVGEVVFNTAITGYQEILTDPSYARQIVTLTHPHIGPTARMRNPVGYLRLAWSFATCPWLPAAGGTSSRWATTW